MPNRWPLPLAGLLLAGLAGAASAQTTYLDGPVDRCAIFRALSSELPADCAGPAPAAPAASRGIVPKDRPAAMGSSVVPVDKGEVWGERTLDYPVLFAYRSSRLTPEAMAFLDQLAPVLASDIMAASKVRIVGHTDTVASEAYNLELSEARAAAVARYLIQKHRLRPGRFEVLGVGESQPIPGLDGADGRNRRVQFTALPPTHQARAPGS